MAVAVSAARTSTHTAPARRGLILALFIGSGAAGLVYQVVWSRELVLVFGNTTQAVSTIVTAFMAGLGFGSLAGGRWADRSANPLRLYGSLELGVAAFAVLLPFAFDGLAELYRGLYPDLVGHTAALTAVRFALALAAVAPATFLMGATLPLLVRHLVRTLDEAGARLGELYAANTAGAVTGTVVAGFVLIEFLGLRLTTYVAVALNLLAGLGARALARRGVAAEAALAPGVAAEAPGTGAEAVRAAGAVAAPGAPVPGNPGGSGARAEPSGGGVAAHGARDLPPRWVILLATFVSGLVSLALEVLWTRMLAEGTGSSIYIFTTILAIFLAGIAIGSALYRRLSSPRRDRAAALGLCLAGVGVLAQATVVLGSGAVGTVPFLVRTVVVLLPATALMGYAFPLAGRLVTPSARTAGGSVGLLYAANTAGSILGSFSAAFILAGTLGTNGSVLLLGGLNLLLGAALVAAGPAWSAADPARRHRGGAGAGPRLAASGLAAVAVLGLVASSLELPITRTATQNRLRATGLPVTHAEDELATVDTLGGQPARRRLLISGVGVTSLTVDTKLMGYLSKALRPQARDLLVVAFGMGSTYRSGLQTGMRTDAVELSPTVPSRMPVFFPDADGFLHHPNGRVITSDGRNYVRLTRDRYDLIAVDPAPPIESAGSVVLYTHEFLSEGRARLRPGGVFLLWMPYALPMEDLKAHVRTFDNVFPHVSLMLSPGGHGMFMFGSDAPLQFSDQAILQVLGNQRALRDLADSPDFPPTDGPGWVRAVRRAEWLADDRVSDFTGPGPEITDDRPRSEYFLWRRAFMSDKAYVNEKILREATP
ncbi:MAG TPA: fused MFS/spermidine synthase [Actinomycetes bacterium]|nr:fused MFS/spermidine synthase [Actinomycetes bacterium]